MKINLFNIEEFIDINKLQEVTSPILFQRGDIPHPNGLISNQIFGITVKSRKNTFAYINLYGHFFHPHVYKAIRRMFRNVEKIIQGEQYYSLNKDGILVLDNENGQTGIEFLYDNWEKINWAKTDKTLGMRNERVDLLKNFKKDEIFMKCLLVIPPFYRDIKSSSSGGETGELNRYYANAIRYAALLKDRDMFSFQLYQTNYNMQNLLVTIYDYFKTKLEKKHGILRKYLLGKNVDFCTRTVITAPSFHANKADELFIDFRHAGVPISQIITLCNPYIVRWVKEFFEKEVFSVKESLAVYDPLTDTTIQAKLDNPESIFTDKWISTMLDTYIRDPESRFNKIELPVKDMKRKIYLQFTGKRYDVTNKSEIASISGRPLTWTDILYLACEDIVKDKHVMVTRYPLTDDFGIFFARIRTVSTVTTQPVMFNGRIYKWYPIIEFDIPHEKIATRFIDSMQFANGYLPGLNGDYDGDQTTAKIIYSQEANEECENIMNSPSYFVNADGKMIRAVEIEPIQTFYVMTKDPDKNSKIVPDSLVDEIINKKPEDFTLDYLVDILGNTVDSTNNRETNVVNAKYKSTDIVNIKKPYLKFTGQSTLGRLLYSKIIIEGCNMQEVIPYITSPIYEKTNTSNENKMSDAIKEKKISSADMYKYVDTRDWLGYELHAVITTSFTIGVLKKPKEVAALQKKLIAQNKKKLEAGDVKVAAEIEKELIDKTKEVLKDDIGMDLYNSGARGSVGNNLKNMNIMRGAVRNLATDSYDIIEGSLMDGLNKKNMAAHSNTILEGAYPKTIDTAISGYIAKELSAAMQTEVLDEKGSDCGSKRTLTVTIPKKYNEYIYRYIIENEKLICLTPDIIQKYVGKTVQMRSPMYCVGKNICNMCAGDDFYLINKKFIGLVATKVGTTCTNLNMKKFHSNLVKIQQLDLNDILI